MAIKEYAMAYRRNQFVQNLRDDFLKGAFGEFMCRQVALAVGKPDNWSKEVQRLLSHAIVMMDKKTPIKGFKDRDLAAQEAVTDLKVILQTKVTFAKSKVSGYYPKLMPRIMHLDFDNEEQYKLMLEEFLPTFVKYL